jgi:type I restriction enzyme R subunit
MPITPEDKARQTIDRLLEAAGWKIQDRKDANLSAPGGVAIREFPMPGFGEADYLLFVDGKAVGVVEAKKEGETLTHVETQTEKYSTGVPDYVDAPVKPLPFRYESTGVETRFTNGLEPESASHSVFAFHKPETLADWLT